jgi:hypothetical protein
MKCYTVLPAYRYAVLEGTGIGEASLAELWCVVVLVAFVLLLLATAATAS